MFLHKLNLPSFWFFSFFILSIFMLLSSIYLNFMSYMILMDWKIINLNSISISGSLIFDQYGCFFSFIVFFISANVFMFSNSYMMEEKTKNYFYIMVMMFILSMNFLIFIPNLIVLLLGWDGLGITSFFLVIYYQTPKSLGAGLITALTNRVGDVLLLGCMGWMFNNFSWIIFLSKDLKYNYMILFMIILAACTKSAQMPFSSWLPAAMAAPTPVSALVHSSTLVTAGIFLLFRFKDSLFLSPIGMKMLLVFSSMTMVMAGTAAIVETDMKKIIALSTLSQLGVMMMSTAIFLPILTLFHLATHALFKALIFISAGNIIHTNLHCQDLRFNSISYMNLPLMSSILLISNLSLVGFPFMAGFFSKDLIIENVTFNLIGFLLIGFMMVATILTSFYSTRLVLSIVFKSNMSFNLIKVNSEDKSFTFPFLILGVMSIIAGCLFSWVFFLPLKMMNLSFSLKGLPLMLVVSGVFLYVISMKMNFKVSVFWFLSSMWFLTPISGQLFLKGFNKIPEYMIKYVDMGWLEFWGPQNMFKFLVSGSKWVQLFQANMISKIMFISMFCVFIFYYI